MLRLVDQQQVLVRVSHVDGRQKKRKTLSWGAPLLATLAIIEPLEPDIYERFGTLQCSPHLIAPHLPTHGYLVHDITIPLSVLQCIATHDATELLAWKHEIQWAKRRPAKEEW